MIVLEMSANSYLKKLLAEIFLSPIPSEEIVAEELETYQQYPIIILSALYVVSSFLNVVWMREKG